MRIAFAVIVSAHPFTIGFQSFGQLSVEEAIRMILGIFLCAYSCPFQILQIGRTMPHVAQEDRNEGPPDTSPRTESSFPALMNL
jgi:hypothetical protein